MHLWLCMFFIKIFSVSATAMTKTFTTEEISVTTSPATVKRKFYKISKSTATWLDALSTCRQEGYSTLIFSSSSLETFKTVRKALQRNRGYSNISVWTGFIKNHYEESNTSEWFREYKCTSIKPDQYNIMGDINTTKQQCVYSSVTDTGVPIVTLHADDCQIKRQFVCYRFENPPVPMELFMDGTYYFNFSHNDLRTTVDSSTTFEKCTDLCAQKRYCVIAVFSSPDENCSIVSHNFEEQINVTLHRSTGTNIKIAVKHGDEVIVQENASTSITEYLEELPCRTTSTTSVHEEYSSPHTSTSTTSVYGTYSSIHTSADILSISHSTIQQSTQLLSLNPSKSSSFQQDDFTKSSFGEITPLQSSSEFTSMHFTQTSSAVLSSYEGEPLTTPLTSVTSATTPLTGVTSATTPLASVTSATTPLITITSADLQMNTTCSCTCFSENDIQGYIFVTKLDKRQLSLFRRRFYSVSDDRLSSRIIGNTGLLIIISAILLIVIIDLTNLANFVRKRKRKERRRK